MKRPRERFQKKKVLFLIETSTSYGRDLLSGMSLYARERDEWNFTIIPRGINESPEGIRSWRGDGIIARTSNDEILKILKKIDCPIVELMYIKRPEVCYDEKGIANLALDHFAEHYFENIGFFSFGATGWLLNRERVFIETAKKRGLTPYVFVNKLSRKDKGHDPSWFEEYSPSLREWLTTLPKPIALLTANDHQAIPLMNHCKEMGLGIPYSVAILGVDDDSHLCNILSPSLSSINVNVQKIGYEAARLLNKKMGGKDDSPCQYLIPPRGVVTRKTTDIFALDNPKVGQALHFIREFATTGIQVKDVLDDLSLSSRTVERYFRESLGHTVEREIFLTKFRHALWLLVHSDFPSYQIAELSGFSSEQYFCQMFKKEKGMTPQRYRRENKESNDNYETSPSLANYPRGGRRE